MMDYLYIVLTVVMLACCFKGPRWGLAALGFILPLSRRLPSPPIPLLNAQNLIVLVAVASLLARRRESGGTAGIRFIFPMLAFAGLVTIGFTNTMLFFVPARFYLMWDPYTIMIVYKSLITCLLIYVCGCMVARSREDIVTVFKGLMFGLAFEAAFVCLEIVTHGPARANGHLYEGNNAGTFLAGALAMSMGAFLVIGWKRREGLFSLGSAVASGIGLIFTLSRGNWISGIVSAGATALLKDRRVLIVLILGVMSYQFWLPEKAMERIDQSFTTAENEPWRYRFREGSDESMAINSLQNRLISGSEGGGDGEGGDARLDSSSQVRLFVWNAALQMIADYPLGVGYGVFQWYIGNYSDVIKFRAAHNSYLLIACELGLPGLATLLLFLACLLYESYMVYAKVDDLMLKAVGLSAFGACVAMMVSACFYNHFFIIEVNGQQWLLLGLAVRVRTVWKSSPAAEPPSSSSQTEGKVPLYRLVT